MALSVPTAKHNLLQWTSTTAAVVLILLQLGASTCTGLALDSQHAIVPQLSKSTSQHRSVTVRPQLPAARTTGTPGFDFAAKYRPPVINFKYQGGPVMTKPIHIYIVWYGAWTANEKRVIKTALSSLTPDVAITKFPNLSNVWKVMTKYYQESSSPGKVRTFVSNKVTVTREADDGATTKTIDSDKDPLNIIIKNINAGKLPLDLEQGVYFVLTASDISYSNSANYCGYHSSVCVQVSSTPPDCKNPSTNLIFSFVPMPASKFQGCNIFNAALPGTPPNKAVSPSGALDSTINVIMHELLELVVDPYPGPMPAWLHSPTENSETGDLCAYNFVADEWFYCGLPKIYTDFDYKNGQCMALGSAPSAGDPPRSLKDPQSGVIFNQYGVGGSQFMVQKIWSLDNKGCVLQPEAQCSARNVTSLDVFSGKIQRGLFFNGVGLQAYAPGQNCGWRLTFSRQVTITFTFDILALAFDDLDSVTVSKPGVVVKKLTMFGKNIVVKCTGNDFFVKFVTFGGRSPYPISAGFMMHYTAV